MRNVPSQLQHRPTGSETLWMGTSNPCLIETPQCNSDAWQSLRATYPYATLSIMLTVHIILMLTET